MISNIITNWNVHDMIGNDIHSCNHGACVQMECAAISGFLPSPDDKYFINLLNDIVLQKMQAGLFLPNQGQQYEVKEEIFSHLL